MTACVVGLGKVGLPLALQFAGKGRQVVGLDVDRRLVDLVNSGAEPFPGEAELATRLQKAVGSGWLRATTDATDAVGSADVVVIVVPLVIGDDLLPDFSAIDAATTTVGEAVRSGTLVIYETTLPIHTTRDRFVPRLQALSGLMADDDLFVCHSPERVYSGRIFADLRRYPKLVGGVGPLSAAKAVAFYSEVLDFDERPDLDRPNGVWDLGSAEAAEMAKLAETTYRNVNIALANELAQTADSVGVDVAIVIESANSQPFSHIHRPGIAVGGHCIPVYPHFLLASNPHAPLVRAALEVNAAMPSYAATVLAEMLGGLDGLQVVVLGATYRGNVKETAFSGVFPLVDALRQLGAQVGVHDPLFQQEELARLGLDAYQLGDQCDAAVLQADHDAYRSLSPRDLPGVKAVVDGRSILDPSRWSGVRRRCIGSPVRPA